LKVVSLRLCRDAYSPEFDSSQFEDIDSSYDFTVTRGSVTSG